MKSSKHNWLYSFILLSFGFFIPVESEAQVAVIGGGNLSTVRSEVTLENKKAIFGYHFGYQLQYYPVKSLEKWSLINELIFTRKGYMQQFEKDYDFHFNYLAVPVLMNYSPISFLSVQGGVEFSKMISTNIKQGLKTYNTFDVGLVFGITAFDNKRISIYSRVTYGLLPMLDYVEMDEIGNFTGDINDIHNLCYLLGIRIKLSNEKVKLYK